MLAQREYDLPANGDLLSKEDLLLKDRSIRFDYNCQTPDLGHHQGQHLRKQYNLLLQYPRNSTLEDRQIDQQRSHNNYFDHCSFHRPDRDLRHHPNLQGKQLLCCSILPMTRPLLRKLFLPHLDTEYFSDLSSHIQGRDLHHHLHHRVP